jgi:hypothetical protein
MTKNLQDSDTNNSNKSDTNIKPDSTQVVCSETSAQKPAIVTKRKKNALTHGVYTEDMLLDWESEDDLIELRDGLWAELVPEGCLEEETVAGIVNSTWQKHRVMRTAHLGFRRDPFGIEASRSNPKSLDDIVQLITSATRNQLSLSTATKESLDALKEAAKKITEINMVCVSGYSQNGPPKEAFEAAQKAQLGVEVVQKILDEQVFTRMLEVEAASKSGAVSVYEKAYSHEHLEKTLRIEAALDARIDKLMGRLVNLKEYKRLRRETSKPALEPASTT